MKTLLVILLMLASPAMAQVMPGQAGPGQYDPAGAAAAVAASTTAAIAAIPRAVLPGTFTIATLPAAADNKAKYAFVTDLGGGADMVLSDGTYWKHIRSGSPASVAATSTLTITPLASAPIQLITGNLTSAMSVSIAGTNLYPGYLLTVRFPGTLTLLGALNIGVVGGPTLPLLGGSWGDFIVDNNLVIQKVRGGQL